MLNLEQHPFFEEYVDEKTGVKSYILRKKVAQIQQNFYFTNPCLTNDGKFLWFRCLNEPSQVASLGVVSLDNENPFIRQFPGTAYKGDNLPTVIPGSSDVMFGLENGIYKINVEGNIDKVLELDKKFLNFRTPERLMTHASISCDGKNIILDMVLAGKVYIAVGNLETGEVNIIHKFEREYDHAQFSPIDPNLILLDQDWRRDYHTGEYFPIDNRIWLMDIRGTRFEPLLQNSWYGHDGTENSHDFWSQDGKVCWVDYAHGAFECDIESRKVTHVWKRPMCHCFTTANRKYWCADDTPYAWKERPCKVLFYDRESNKELEIFSALPYPEVPRGGNYHLDPHPTFSKDGKYIISMVTVYNGQVDIAITPVEPLIEACKAKGTIVE